MGVSWSICGRLSCAPLALAILHFFSSVSADCYAHNGVSALNSTTYNRVEELVSCGRDTNNCCFRGEICASNLLCYTSDKKFVARQWCAVESWDKCSDFAPDHEAGGVGLTDCGNNAFAIGTEPGNCERQLLYYIDPDTGEVHNASTRSSTAEPTSWTVDSLALLASATPISSSVVSNTVVVSSETVTAITSTTNSPAPTNPVPSPESSSQLSAGAGAGIGVGCAVAVAGISISIWLWRRERKKRRKLEAQVEQGIDRPPPIHEVDPTPKTVYAHANQGSSSALPPQELDGTPRNEAP